MVSPKPILTIPVGEHSVSVVEIGDELHVTFNVGRPGPFITHTIRGYWPAFAGMDDMSALAGRLPEGAVNARVRDVLGDWTSAETGAGVWIAVVTTPTSYDAPPVLFEDADGGIVPPPPDLSAEVVEVADATGPCPACEAIAWQWADKSAVGEGSFLRCGTCGFAHGMWSSYAPVGSAGADHAPEPEVEHLRWEPDVEEISAAAAFPVYALSESWTGERGVGGYGGGPAELSQLTLRHGSHGRQGTLGAKRLVEVQSGPLPNRSDSSLEARARQALSWLLFHAMPSMNGLTEAQFHVRHLTDDRERERRAASAPHRREVIDIDGKPCPFEVVEDPEAWAAAAELDSGCIVISGAGIGLEDIDLVTVSDLGSYGSGRD